MKTISQPRWIFLFLLVTFYFTKNYAQKHVLNNFIKIEAAENQTILNQGIGLLGLYYDQDGPSFNFTAPLTHIKVDETVNKYWEQSSPIPGIIGSDNFSVRWLGQIQPPQSGVYKFHVNGDDGVRLYIDNKLVIDDWRDTSPLTRVSNDIVLEKNKKYEIKLEFYERFGGATIILAWSYENGPVKVISKEFLYPKGYCELLKNKITPDTQAFCKGGPIQPLTGDSNDEALMKQAYYQWEYSLTNAPYNWQKLAGEKDQNLGVAVYDEDRWYRRIIFGTQKGLCDNIVEQDSFKISVSNVAYVKGSSFFAPNVDAGPNSFVCDGISVQIGGNPTVTGGAPPYNILWDFSQYLNDATVSNPVATVPQTTIFTVYATDSNNCLNLHQTVVNLNNATTMGTSTEICFGGEGVFIGSNAIPGENALYQWTPSTGLSCTNCPNPKANPDQTTIYNLTKQILLKDGTTCESTASILVRVVGKPSKRLNDEVICFSPNGVSIPIGYAPEAGFSYKWLKQDFLSRVDVPNPTFSTAVLLPKELNPIEYILQIKGGGCEVYDTMQIYMLFADAGPDGIGPRTLGKDYHPNIPATYRWSVVSGPDRIKGDRNKAVIEVDYVYPEETIYELEVCFRNRCCRDQVRVGPTEDPCTVEILYNGDCPDRTLPTGLKAVNGFEIPPDANPNLFNYTWLPCDKLDKCTGDSVNVIGNFTGVFFVKVTHPSRPGFECFDTITIYETKYPELEDKTYRVCKPGDAIELGGVVIPGARYLWQGPGGYSSGLPNPVVYPMELPVYYYVTVTDVNNNCSTTDTAKVDYAVLADAGKDQYVCPGAIVRLGGIDTTGGQWKYSWFPVNSPWQNGTDERSPRPEVLVATNLTFYVTVTDTKTGCTDMDTTNIIVDANGPDLSFKNETICPGGEVKIGPEEIAFASYNWSPAEGLSCTDCPNPIASPAQTTTYTLKITLSGDCNFLPTGNIKVTVLDTSDILLDDIIKCPGSPLGDVELNSGGEGICEECTYNWSPVEGLSDSQILNPTTSIDKNTVYTLVSEFKGKCTKEVKVSVQMKAVEPLEIKEVEKCPGKDNTEINAGLVGICEDCTYTWTPVEGLSDPKVLNPTTSVTTSVVYRLEVTKPDGCKKIGEVKVNVKPSEVLQMEDIEKCYTGPGVAINRQLIGECTGCRYEWTPSVSLTSPSSINPLTERNQTTTYSLKVTQLDGCWKEGTVKVNVVSRTSAGPNKITCVGNAVEIGNPLNDSNSSYEWTPSAGLDNPKAKLPIFTPSMPGGYQFVMTELREVNGYKCPLMENVFVTVETLKEPTVEKLVTACKGTCVKIGPLSEAGFTYKWFPINGLSCSDCAQPEVCVESTTTYRLTMTKNISGCKVEIPVLVSVVNVSLPGITLPDYGVCKEGQSELQLEAEVSPSGNYTYSWSPSNNLSSAVAQQPILKVSSMVPGQYEYTLSVNDLNSGCMNIRKKTKVTIVNKLATRDYEAIECQPNLGPYQIDLDKYKGEISVMGNVRMEYYGSLGDAQLQQGVLSKDQMITGSRTYYVRTVLENGDCYQINRLDIKIGELRTRTEIREICEREKLEYYGKTLTETGTYTFEVPINGALCDSIIVLDLRVNPLLKREEEVSLCEG